MFFVGYYTKVRSTSVYPSSPLPHSGFPPSSPLFLPCFYLKNNL